MSSGRRKSLMPNIGLPEILIVLIIALVVFGPKKLPELGRSLGKGINEFKDGMTGGDDAPKSPIHELAHTKAESDSETPVEGEIVTVKHAVTGKHA
jgi:sec-independent protein translocase protein TatA